MNDDTFEFNDPYANLYQTPQKKNETLNSNQNKNHTQPKHKKENNNKNVFNPYEQQKNDIDEKQAPDDLPKYVDLTKNAYERKDSSQGDYEELPLLEELGICPENIKMKLVSVLTFHKIDKRILVDADMAGPLLVFILFGISLVLVKLNFYFSKPKLTLDICTDYHFLVQY